LARGVVGGVFDGAVREDGLDGAAHDVVFHDCSKARPLVIAARVTARSGMFGGAERRSSGRELLAWAEG
jgi:hypothetical protein